MRRWTADELAAVLGDCRLINLRPAAAPRAAGRDAAKAKPRRADRN